MESREMLVDIKQELENKKFNLFIKRAFDIIVSLIALIILAIPMLVIAICIKIEDGSPAIFKQVRMVKNLKPFNIYKFRTMKTQREELNSELSHEEMVTKVGKVLRATSIDELPQLINILKGEMSFIGPRPWIVEYYEWFTDEQKRRSDVRPGITGLAAVKGRNGINIFKKINYDIEYVDNMSLWLDIKIFFWSIVAVFKKTNAEISERGIKDELTELREQKEKVHV